MTQKCLLCDNPVHGQGYCDKHYARLMKTGDPEKRTMADLNEIEINGSIATIWLYDENGERITTTLIDSEDVEKVKEYKWGLNGQGYARNNKIDTKQHRCLHRFLVDAPTNLVVDHINGDILDNRKSNLRICTRQQNSQHKVKLRKNNKSGVTGVMFVSKEQRWCPFVHVNGKPKILGYFKDKQEAIEVRKKAEDIYYKEFKPTIKEVWHE